MTGGRSRAAAEAAASGQAPGRALGAGCEAAVREGPQRPRRGAGPARPGPIGSDPVRSGPVLPGPVLVAVRRSVAVGAPARASPEAGQGGCGGAGRVRQPCPPGGPGLSVNAFPDAKGAAPRGARAGVASITAGGPSLGAPRSLERGEGQRGMR